MGPKRPRTQPYSKERFESAKKLFLPGKKGTAHRTNIPDHFTKGPYTLRNRNKMNTATISPTWIDDDNDEDYDPSPCRIRKRKPRGKCSPQCKKQAKTHPSDVIADVNEDESFDSSTLVASSQMAFTSIEANERTRQQTTVDPEALSDFSYPVTTHGETEPHCHSTFDRCQDIPEKQHPSSRDNKSTEE